jgi:putative phosphoribosyl transferase
VAALRAHAPAQIVVAVPVAASESCELFADKVDCVVCLETPDPFFGVGLWYGDFSQVRDDEVRDLLARAPIRKIDGAEAETMTTVASLGSSV